MNKTFFCNPSYPLRYYPADSYVQSISGSLQAPLSEKASAASVLADHFRQEDLNGTNR